MWGYMDVVCINGAGDVIIAQAVRIPNTPTGATSRKFHNLVAKLSDPDHDLLKIKRSYFQ
ncbi:hypothetical protein D3C81_2317340 [compost metagenome]